METELKQEFTANDITVIIPCYNAAKTILNALNSIDQQTVSIKEIIIIDDGSTDNSVQLCSQWASSNKIEVKIISQKNSGVSSARNVGIRAVQTSLIAFLDSDDSWVQTKIEKQLKIFNSYSKAVLVSTGSNILPTTGKTLLLSKQLLLKRNRIVTSSVLIKTDIMKQNLFDTELHYSEDYNIWLKLACSGQFLLMIDSELIHYSTERTNKLSSKQKQFHKNEIESFKKLEKEHYISVLEFLSATFFSNIKYLNRILFPRRFK